MAQIQTIYSPEVEKQLKAVYGELEKHHKKVVEMSKLSLDFAGGKTAQNPAQIQQVEAGYKKIAQSAEKLRLQEIKLQQAREKAFDNYEAKLKKEQARLEASQNTYNRVQTALNKLSNEYKALAIRKELGATLTAKEEQRYATLQARITKYDTALKAVDASMGKYQRNVGNYASAWNPLSNSINQLTREMPAFANSVQTGFMAISNNLPIFFDAMQQVIDQNKQLQAQGQPTQSLFKQLATSLFSWGSALSVGVTLLTVFGAKIVESITNSKKKKEALEAEKKATEERNNAEKQAFEQQARYASEEISRSKILLETAKNVNLSYNERLSAVNELQSRYPDYLGLLSREEILAGNTAIAEQKLNQALMNRAMFLAIKDKIADATQKLVEQELKLAKATGQTNEQQELYNYNANQAATAKGKLRLATDAEISGRTEENQLIEEYNKRLKEEGLATLDARTSKALKNKETRSELDILFRLLNDYSKYSNVVVADTKNTKENTKAKKENNKEKQKEQQFLQGTEDYYEDQINKLTQIRGRLADTSDEYGVYTKSIDELIAKLKALRGEREKSEVDGVELDLEAITDDAIGTFTNFEAEMRQRAKGALDAWAGQNGFPTLFAILNKDLEGFGNNWYDTTQGIIGATQEMVNFISQITSQNFQQQYEQLEQQKAVQILFAGESVEARQRIEEQYEERRRQIQKRQAEAEKKLALFNIAANTAKGVVSALGMTPPNIPLSIVIGAIGAAQLAFVASQQIPQFWTGTDNAPGGLAWTQEKGQEIITDKYGNIKDFGDNKGARLTMLEQGDKVFNAEHTKRMLFNRELQGVLNLNGISSNGLTKQDFNDGINRLMQRDGISINIDKNGFATSLVKGNTRRNQLNNNLRLKGNAV